MHIFVPTLLSGVPLAHYSRVWGHDKSSLIKGKPYNDSGFRFFIFSVFYLPLSIEMPTADIPIRSDVFRRHSDVLGCEPVVQPEGSLSTRGSHLVPAVQQWHFEVLQTFPTNPI